MGAEANRRQLYLVLAITLAMVAVQLVGVLFTGSLALLADTYDKIVDLAALVFSLVTVILVARPETPKRSWGLRRLEVIAGCVRAAITLGLAITILVEAVGRLRQPPELPHTELIWFGVFGLVANIAKLLVLLRGASTSFNMRAVLIDAWNDALGSIGVLIAAIIMATTGFTRADAIVSILIIAVIAPRAFSLLKETTNVLLEASPPGLDLAAVRGELSRVPGVMQVQDLHATLIDAGLPTISAHLVVAPSVFTSADAVRELLDKLETCATTEFGIPVHHTTFQLEPYPSRD